MTQALMSWGAAGDGLVNPSEAERRGKGRGRSIPACKVGQTVGTQALLQQLRGSSINSEGAPHLTRLWLVRRLSLWGILPKKNPEAADIQVFNVPVFDLRFRSSLGAEKRSRLTLVLE